MLELPDLAQIILKLLQQIPKGRVATYQALAVALGDKIAARVIPQLMAPYENDPSSLGYKVIQSDGAIPAKTESERREKEQRLQAEGISVKNGQVISLSNYLFRDFQCDAPLVKLQRRQLEARERLVLQSERNSYRTVGGIDLSYAGPVGVAAYVSVQLPARALVRADVEAQEVRFPYIPSYLAFRELPVMFALMQKLKDRAHLADITLVDGNGTLHHRHAGIACQLGVMLDVATIGITKSLLYGHPEKKLELLKPGDVCYLEGDGEKLGAAIQSQSQTEPFFVSPGHKIDLETAIEITRACLGEGRLPEPIQLAHNTSREAAQALKPQRPAQKKTAPSQESKPSPRVSAQKGLFDKT
jgi:deoxyribonuclease V